MTAGCRLIGLPLLPHLLCLGTWPRPPKSHTLSTAQSSVLGPQGHMGSRSPYLTWQVFPQHWCCLFPPLGSSLLTLSSLLGLLPLSPWLGMFLFSEMMPSRALSLQLSSRKVFSFLPRTLPLFLYIQNLSGATDLLSSPLLGPLQLGTHRSFPVYPHSSERSHGLLLPSQASGAHTFV